jgi:hypothetical protein
MIIDGSQLFTGTSNGASGGITASSYADSPTTGTQAASNVIDYGITNGTPAGGATTPANRDMGIGDDPSLKVCVFVTTTFVGATSMQLQLQGAPDNASGVSGTYYTLWTSQVFAEATLLAGAVLANIDFPREYINALTTAAGGPIRYLKLNFITSGTHTGGAVEAFIGLDQEQAIFSGVTGVVARSGYPAGINVAN